MPEPTLAVGLKSISSRDLFEHVIFGHLPHDVEPVDRITQISCDARGFRKDPFSIDRPGDGASDHIKQPVRPTLAPPGRMTRPNRVHSHVAWPRQSSSHRRRRRTNAKSPTRSRFGARFLAVSSPRIDPSCRKFSLMALKCQCSTAPGQPFAAASAAIAFTL